MPPGTEMAVPALLSAGPGNTVPRLGCCSSRDASSVRLFSERTLCLEKTQEDDAELFCLAAANRRGEASRLNSKRDVIKATLHASCGKEISDVLIQNINHFIINSCWRAAAARALWAVDALSGESAVRNRLSRRYGSHRDKICRRALGRYGLCEPHWLRRGWPGAQSMALGSWEEQKGMERSDRGKEQAEQSVSMTRILLLSRLRAVASDCPSVSAVHAARAVSSSRSSSSASLSCSALPAACGGQRRGLLATSAQLTLSAAGSDSLVLSEGPVLGLEPPIC
ncbi:hypothetical protein EYF80_023697 [Liparis tanakae]|uniref:Uncharacterized protein n=1 Tax=Liparis tanakae TaxID=230148 RepID=A0A4Z2HJI3_9TELE|nr:hypothetical protein EYF80_023697 [Liparis tanakae]